MSKRTLPSDRSQWTKEEEKDFLDHYAKVLDREALVRASHQPDFSKTLSAWADKARAQAAGIDTRPPQMDLFG